jgi:hypothetical protein
MEINALINGIRGGDEDAVRELIRSRGADVLAHATALCDGDRPAARAVATEAFRNAVAHIRAFPEETFDETALCARIDAELLEAARTYGGRSVGEIVSGQGWQSLRPQQAEEVPPKPAPADRRRRKKTRLMLAFILLLPCAVAALWLFYGIIASMGWLPYADLGYTWFNRTVFQIF